MPVHSSDNGTVSALQLVILRGKEPRQGATNSTSENVQRQPESACRQQDIFFRNTNTHLIQFLLPCPNPALRFVNCKSDIMHQIIPILYLATAGFTAALMPFPLAERSIGQSCSIDGESGTCQDTSDCTTQGYNEAGYCPGPTNVQCCVKKTCSTSSGSGICLNTDNTCSGSFVAGACPGDSTVQVSPSRSLPSKSQNPANIPPSAASKAQLPHPAVPANL